MKKTKEELGMIWSAHMSKFMEDVSQGKASYDNIKEYFSKEELNNILPNEGKVKDIIYNKELKKFSIVYESSFGVPYVAEVKQSGEITNIERTDSDKVLNSDVWISYFQDSDGFILTYSSYQDVTYEGKTLVRQLNATEGSDYIALQSYNEGYTRNEMLQAIVMYFQGVKKIVIIDEIRPKHSKDMFRYSVNCLEYEGLEKIDFSLCGLEQNAFGNCNITSVKLSNTVENINSLAFSNCPSLVQVEFLDKLTTINSNAFSNCPNLRTIKINKEANSVIGATWGASNANVVWRNE